MNGLCSVDKNCNKLTTMRQRQRKTYASSLKMRGKNIACVINLFRISNGHLNSFKETVWARILALLPIIKQQRVYICRATPRNQMAVVCSARFVNVNVMFFFSTNSKTKKWLNNDPKDWTSFGKGRIVFCRFKNDGFCHGCHIQYPVSMSRVLFAVCALRCVCELQCKFYEWLNGMRRHSWIYLDQGYGVVNETISLCLVQSTTSINTNNVTQLSINCMYHHRRKTVNACWARLLTKRKPNSKQY